MRYPKVLLLFAVLAACSAQPVLAQPRFVPDPRAATEAEILEAGEIWASLQETLSPWGGKRSERGPDGKVRLEAVLYNTAVRDLAWMIHNRYPPLVRALGTAAPAPPDTRCAAIETRWPGLIDKLAK